MFDKKIILGSASPRRKELIESLGLSCEVRKKSVEESYPDDLSVIDVPAFLAERKAEPLKAMVKENEVLITSDTVVIFENKILHKPKDEKEAIETLQNLSGHHHVVITGVHLYSLKMEDTFSDKTEVYFNPLTSEEITYYVNNFSPYDKAGSYAIQEWIGKIGIRKIEGCFYNVMGLPVDKVWGRLNEKFSS